MSVKKYKRRASFPGIDLRTSSGGNPVKQVSTESELRAAVTAQTSGQIIQVLPGTYTLTASLTIPVTASGGTLEAIGAVKIVGAASVDQAILINPAVASASFAYKMVGFDSIKGGAQKIGINIKNATVGKKVMLELIDCNIENSSGTPAGAAMSVIDTDGSNAIRVYMTGGSIDSVLVTPKDNAGRMYFNHVDINEDMTYAVVDCTHELRLIDCLIPHAGIKGGHANNLVGSIHSYTYESTAPAAADGSDFPNDFNPTIV